MQTGYQSVARLSYHCFLTENKFSYPDKTNTVQSRRIQQHLIVTLIMLCSACVIFFKTQRVELFTEMKEKQSAQVNLSHTEAGWLALVLLSHRSSFQFHYHPCSKWTLKAFSWGEISTWDKHRKEDPLPLCSSQVDHPPVSLEGWVTRRRERKGCDEQPQFHTINYSDFTSLVVEDSAGKGQPSGSHRDQLTMHVTAPAGQASALPTSHFKRMTNDSTRLLIAPQMPSSAC